MDLNLLYLWMLPIIFIYLFIVFFCRNYIYSLVGQLKGLVAEPSRVHFGTYQSCTAIWTVEATYPFSLFIVDVATSLSPLLYHRLPLIFLTAPTPQQH